MNQRHLYILVTLLCAIGGGLFLYKHFILGFPLSPETTEQTWQYEVRIRFDGTGEAAKISLHIPTGNRSLAVLGEDFFSGRFGLGTARDTDGNRVALWTIRTAKGRQTLFYRATLQRQANRESATTTAPSSPPAVQAPDFSDSEAKAAQALMDQVRARSADATTLVTQLLTLLAKPGPETALLIKPRDTDETRLDMAARLLALAGLPARVAHGIELSSQNAQPKIHAWLEVFMGRSWQLFDLATQQRVSRSQVLVIWRGAGGIASLRGGERLDTRVTLTPGSELATRMLYRQAGSAGHWLLGFSLLGLPLETQQVYRVLLTVPLGVLVLVLLRNLVGIKTFGTFMPVLVALAFRQTEL
ncbi:MAG: UUP1 family membrane protein, partial [Gammaproteobacteria bacterium]